MCLSFHAIICCRNAPDRDRDGASVSWLSSVDCHPAFYLADATLPSAQRQKDKASILRSAKFCTTESCRSRVKVSVTLLTMPSGAEKWLRDMFMSANLHLTSFQCRLQLITGASRGQCLTVTKQSHCTHTSMCFSFIFKRGKKKHHFVY